MEDSFRPLLDVLSHGHRLTARPGRVLLDRSGGPESVEVEWGADAHASAVAALDGPKEIAPGVSAVELHGTLVLLRSPDPNLRLDDLRAEGFISPLAARTLDAALDLRRNVLVAGEWPQASRFISALVSGASRPACFADPLVPAPVSWARFGTEGELLTLNPDRAALGQLPPPEVPKYASVGGALVSWIGASRLDQALMRYEAAFERADPRLNAQLQVLVSVDLVVTLSGGRVHHIAEVAMVEDGYRPRLLFAPGEAPMQNSLVPVDVPSFVHELRVAGQGPLAEELIHAAGAFVPPADPVTPRPTVPSTASPPPVGSVAGSSVPKRPSGPSAAIARRSVSVEDMESLRDAPPPGWELDQLGDEDLPTLESEEQTADDAVLAATYGLAPPPRPRGVPGEAFNDILKKMRDGELGEDKE
ncbi:MAG: hypothetical protein AAFU77_16840 [Myxococcota bacterium]